MGNDLNKGKLIQRARNISKNMIRIILTQTTRSNINFIAVYFEHFSKNY